MNGVFIDSNVFLEFLKGEEKAKVLLEKYLGPEGCINDIVFSEVLFVYIKAETGRESYELKGRPELMKSVELDHIFELLGRYRMLDVGEVVASEAGDLIRKYGLLPNDALIAATPAGTTA
ncbi:MAG TPA: type II toxin-antitoxin system VapC family toxin [Candidatus Syntrophoarchaeum butanivorans]|uniref:Ribonuclease VapC2 n=1 Tax=Candidatus Syntropharchaeum butanivorans TaxID=1839936 RepID=A0A1F2P367_9EURY|nr:MAG: ribonuclease VapC2 [Candidatus Syntrophoarchaeum butanivorans]HEC56824.1 type II toxin-antitoxin system VapC family toxin [Candidatus Syntrophoarchaeum butanivorans]